jgi:hypothetical protein
VPLRIGVFFGVFVIYAIDFRRLHDDITGELERSKYRTRISREVGIPSTSYAYDDSSLIDMSESSASDKILSHTLSRYSTRHTYIDPCVFYSFSDSQSVDDRTHHTHIVTGHSIESTCLELYPSEYISSSYYDDDFKFFIFDKMNNFLSKKGKKFWINTISLISLKSFSGKL